MTEAEAGAYLVKLMPYAERQYLNITGKRALQEVDVMLEVLDTVPGIGRSYQPSYPAAPAPTDGLMVVYASHYGIYYVVDENPKIVSVVAIEDQRRNPMNRFAEEN